WNRFLQTLDYANRPVSRNRAQTKLEADGSFRIVLAHRDPGHPNWIDTEGAPYSLVFWRFMLAGGEVETPQGQGGPFAGGGGSGRTVSSDLGVSGVRVFDLQIAIRAFEGGAGELWTHDAGFLRVPGLRVRDPLAVRRG